MFRDTLLAAAAAASLVFSGCGPSKPPARYTIALIPKGLTHQHWQSVHRGGLRAATDFGSAGIPIDLLWEGPNTEGDAREQIGLVNQMAGRGVSALVLAPQSSTAMIPCVREAVDRSIPVVVIDSGLKAEELYVKYVATNNRNGGRMAARHLLDSLAAGGKKAPRLILLRYQQASESTEEREKGFLAVVNEENEKRKTVGQPAITVVSDNEYSGPTVESAMAVAGPLIEKFKDSADAIFACNESATTGVLNILRNKELLGKMTVMGFDQSKPLLQALRDGTLVGTVAQDPYRMGYLAVHAAVRHLEGDDVSGKDKYLPTGEYLITKENVDSDETRSRIEEDAQARRTIDTPKYPRRK